MWRKKFVEIINLNARFHVETSMISCQMNQFVFSRSEDDVITSALLVAVTMYAFQQSTIFLCTDVVRQNINVVHEFQWRHF